MNDTTTLDNIPLIVTAFVANHTCGATDLPGLLRLVHAALTGGEEPSAAPKKGTRSADPVVDQS